MSDKLNEKYPITKKREDGALRNFKQVNRALTALFRHSVNMETVLIYWVNRSREQFVLETAVAANTFTSFKDRIPFQESYLNKYRDIREPVSLEIGKDVQSDELKHYLKEVPVSTIYLYPFESNNETIAITVLESRSRDLTEEQQEAIQSYQSAFSNLLFTFLELNDLSRSEEGWIEYEEMLDLLHARDNHVILLDQLVTQLQSMVMKGGVTLIARGQEMWQVLLNSAYAHTAPPIGLTVSESSIAYEALKTGKPEFHIHFNSNPRRIQLDEPLLRGATLAVPILLHDRRQAVVLIYDENPLVFKESSKHKMVNLVRVAALHIMASKVSMPVNSDFLVSEQGAFKSELLERVLQRLIRRSGLFPDEKTWFGLVTVAELSELRTRLRMEELRDFQKKMVNEIAPVNLGLCGLVCSHADYLYGVVLQQPSEHSIELWKEAVQDKFSEPYPVSDHCNLHLNIQSAFVEINDRYTDASNIIQTAKQALNASMKHRV